MKKLAFASLFLLSIASIAQAQLEVKDTLLMAFRNDIFWSSSSELETDNDPEDDDMAGYADYGRYGSLNLADNDATSCWAEGSKSDGTNEFIWMTIPVNTITIRIRNGYQKNETIYFANNRPKNIVLELYACYEPLTYVTESHNGFFISESIALSVLVLKDKLGYQDIKLDFDWSEISSKLSDIEVFDKDQFILKIMIKDVYKGTKYNDACISDINIVPNPYFEITLDDHGLLKKYESKTDTLFYDKETVYQVVELSPNLKWIIFILMPSDIENSRVETIYKLYNTNKEQFIEIENVFEMYGFVKKSGDLYLEGSDKNFNDVSISLDDL